MGWRRLGVVLMAVGLTSLCAGCWSAGKKVAREIPRLSTQWQTNVLHQAALAEQPITWPEAVALMQANNLKLRRARIEITNAQENVRQVFQDLLPTFDLHGNVSHSLANLSSISFDDVTFNVDSFFNIPGIATFSSRLFAAQLSLMRAVTAGELAEREQAIELYKLFLGCEDAREAAEDIRADQQLADKIMPIDELAARVLLDEIQRRRLALEKEGQLLQDGAAEVLGTREKLWLPRTNGWPVFTYESEPLPVADTNRVAHLQIRLLAIELVGAWAQLQGIKLQYWPELTFFISGPSVYSFSGGSSCFWDANQVRATADMFWRLDTRGNITRQLRQTRRDQELQKARLRQESLTLIARIVAAQKLSASLRAQLAQVEEVLPLLEQLPPPRQFAAIINNLETIRALREQERKLRHDLAELNTIFWFVDDAKWPASAGKSG